MDASDAAYRPIACTLHDELEAAATRRSPVALVYTTPEGAERVIEARIVDVGSRGGAEYLRLSTGAEIRLDRILELDGLRFKDEGR